MSHPIRSLVVAAPLAALALGLAACGSSGSDASPPPTAPASTTTTAGPTTSTSEAGAPTTTAGDTSTTAPASPPDCQALLREYAERFDPDDLTDTVAFFREHAPSMPDDVAAAVERVAAAYEKAGDLGHLDLGSIDLTADAQTFSDWTNDGCPAG